MTANIPDALAHMRRQFADQLPVRVDSILAHFREIRLTDWHSGHVEELHLLLHGLNGAAGTFGLESVSIAAHAVETRLAALIKSGTAPSATDWHSMSNDLDELSRLTRGRLDSGDHSFKQPPVHQLGERMPLIHLVEDDPAQAAHLSQVLRDDGYRVEVFTTPAGFRAATQAPDAQRPAAVVMDMIFPEGDDTGASLIAELALGEEVGVPVVIASMRDDLPGRLAAFRAGATRYMLKPIEGRRLIDQLDSLTGRQPPQPYRVLIVDDDPLLLDACALVLREAGMDVQTLSEPLRTVEVVDHFDPEVVLLDVYMPDASGPELAAVLRERDAQLHLPIVFLSVEADMSKQLLALKLGGDDFLVKPVRPDHLVAAVTSRAKRARERSTYRRRLEVSLYERDREHQALNQHAIVSIADRAGNITYVNDKFCEISGYARADLIGHNHRILKSNEHPQAFYEKLWQTIASGNVWRGEVCNRRKDGSLYWVESTITPFIDSQGDGRPYQYVSIRTDITYIKVAESTSEVYKERLRRAQNFANIGTWEWNVQTGALFWSERIAPLFGYPGGELETSYENFIAAIHADDRQLVLDAVNACVERDVPYDIEHRVVWPDGTERWLQERGAVVRDASGKALQMLGVVQDIDKRKRAELELEFFREMVEHTAQPVFMIDVEKGYQLSYVNAAAAAHWGASRDELLGWSIPDWDPNFDQQRVDGRFAAMVGQSAVLRETQHRLKNGQIVPVEVFSNARIIAGRPYIFGSFLNISARKETEQFLRAAKDEADQANRAKSDFLSSMSHELRTPMNAILGFGQLIQYDDKLSAEHKDNVHEIIKAGHHLLNLINEVLDLAKVESGHFDLSLEPVEVLTVVGECLNLVETLAAQRSIQISHKDLEGAIVRADRTRLKQSLLNLITNAIKYNREGGSVMLSVAAQDTDRLRILVADTGPGISANRLAELFLPFHRLDAENSDIEGTGIGLTITRRIVEMMGGNVDVCSEVGVGSTFWIELPIEFQTESMCTPTVWQDNDDSEQNLRKMTEMEHLVLYIEDNPSNIKLVTQILGRRKHIHLLTAHTPELGFELALARRPELILLDINMPGMDGYQVLRLLRADDRLKAIPVIAVTANAMLRDVERGKAAGFADYLTKPLDVAQFLGLLDRYLLESTKSKT